MSNTIIRPKSRNEWLEARKSGIGSSEVGTIVGLNPFETPFQLWRRKLGIDPPQEENFAMKAGHYLEDAVSRFWQDETNRDVIKASAGDWLIQCNEKPFMQVSPDRTYWITGAVKNNSNKGILECKTTQKEIDPDNVPQHWFCQLQYQLGVAELTQGSLAWLSAGRTFDYQDYTFNPEFFGWLSEEVEKFWVDNVLGKKEPTALSVKDILLKYNHHSAGKIVEVTEELFDAYKDLKEVKKELDALDERKTELEEKLKLAFGDAEAISFDGQTLATWKAAKDSEKFDAKAFQAENPELAKPYIKTVAGSRRFLLK